MAFPIKGAVIFGQSGGPTAVINASAYGVIKEALSSPNVTNVYCAEYGIKGILNDRLFDMSKEDPEELKLLLKTPSSAFGSCRYKIADPEKDDTDYKRILEIFKKYDVRYFFYNGGNDSMDTCNKISRFFKNNEYDCRVIGIPKTIDNDLVSTDHCPGYGSAAKYIATTCAELLHDTVVYGKGTITVVEIMGRHAGWLTAASALSRVAGAGPDLIYMPEVTFDMDDFVERVKRIYAEKGNVFIAVSEGIHYSDGRFVSEAMVSENDGFGHAQLGGLAARLVAHLKGLTGAKVRGIEFSLLQRCASHIASKTDVDEAFNAGKTALEAAIAGETGKMVCFRREYENGEYICRYELAPLDGIANAEKKVPLEWIDTENCDIRQEFFDYALPLIRGGMDNSDVADIPRYVNLKKILAQ